MPVCQTKFHGQICFEPEQVLQVPRGLFGFTEETQFLLLEQASSRPLAFLQSVHSANLCFLSLPVQVIDADYTLSVHPGDLKEFGYSKANPPVMGRDVLCLALLTLGGFSLTGFGVLGFFLVGVRHYARPDPPEKPRD